MVSSGLGPGTAKLLVIDGVALLRPEEQVFASMLTGFANQQLARNLARTTVEGRESTVKAFAAYVNTFPWRWTPGMVDEWLGDLRSLRDLKRSTIRSYSEAVRAFCSFVTDPLYEWAATCEERFGTYPVQVVHEWNTAVHVQDNEADPKKRAFTKAELHAFFAHCDDEVARIRAFGRKGWLPAFRDATLFKTAYAFGLRRNETRMLDAADFGRNPHGVEFGEWGRCQVRFGKAKKGSPPKRRSVLTVWDWAADVLQEWFSEVRPLFGVDANPAAWPSERGLRIGCQRLDSRFISYPPGPGPGRRPGLPLAAKVICHASDRGRLGSPVRAGTGRPRARLHHLDLHLRVVGLPHPHPAPSPGRHHCRGLANPRRE